MLEVCFLPMFSLNKHRKLYMSLFWYKSFASCMLRHEAYICIIHSIVAQLEISFKWKAQTPENTHY